MTPPTAQIEERQAESKRLEVFKSGFEAKCHFVEPVSSFLKNFGYCAVVLTRDDISTEALLEGLRLEFDDSHIRDLGAEGHVQGEPVEPEASTLSLRKIDGMGPEDLVIMSGISFHPQPDSGTPEVRERLAGIVSRHIDEKEHNGIDPMVFAMGVGSEADLPTSGRFYRQERTGFVANLAMRIAFDGQRLSTYINPGDLL